MFSTELKDILKKASMYSIRYGSEELTINFFLLAALDGDSRLKSIITQIDPNLPFVLKTTIENNYIESSSETLEYKDIPQDKEMQRVFKYIQLEVQTGIMKTLTEISTAEVLYAILKDGELMNSKTAEILNKLGITKEALSKVKKETIAVPQTTTTKQQPKKNVLLDNLCRHISQEAEDLKLDPVIGRDAEIERVIDILSRKKKNNPVLIGDAGVGKTTIVEGLAQKIVNGEVPESLKQKRIYELILNDMVSGTKLRGQFEERMKALIDELERNDNIILFIDELHSIVGTGNPDGGLDVSNIFKPHLAKGKIQIIGATTLAEYGKSIEKDLALERRFQKIIVKEPSREECIAILTKIKDGENGYENFHKVYYTKEAIEACVDLSIRYITNRFLPDKAIDLLDEVGAKSKTKRNLKPNEEYVVLEKRLKKNEDSIIHLIEQKKFNECQILKDENEKIKSQLLIEIEKYQAQIKENKPYIDKSDVEKTLSAMIDVPISQLSQDELEKIKNLPMVLSTEIFGQEYAVEKVIKSLKRNKLDIRDENKPIGSFIFLGPTGTGKTYLAELLAKYIFNDSLIRVNMSEFTETYNITKLVGATAGYIGYHDTGHFTEKVRRNPYSVILFDEIEKAHPTILNILTQILNTGFLKDGSNNNIDFRNTIIIMTTNAIINPNMKNFGFVNNKENEAGIINTELEKHFSKELLNSVDEKILFNNLKEESITIMLDNFINKFKTNLFNKIGLEILIDPSVNNYILRTGYDEKLGIRSVKNAFQERIQNVLTDKLINDEIKYSDKVSIIYEDEALKFVTYV